MGGTLETELRARLEGAFESQLQAKMQEFGNLLSREAAIRLLCKQNGIAPEERLSLSEARKARGTFIFSAKVDRIFPIQSYSSSQDRSVRLHISDGTCDCTLLLWNEQVSEVFGNVSVGDTIECSGAYSRSGEIGLSKSGNIRRIGRFPLSSLDGLREGVCSAIGVAGDSPIGRSYADKRTGEEKRMFSFSFCQGEKCVRVVAWQGGKGDFTMPSKGDRLLLENAFFRNGELHAGQGSRLVVLSKAGGHDAVLEKVFLDGDSVMFLLGGKELCASLEDGLRILGIDALPPGVSAETAVQIKSSRLVGEPVTYFSEGNALVSIDFSKKTGKMGKPG